MDKSSGRVFYNAWGHPIGWAYHHVTKHHPYTNTLMDTDIKLESSTLGSTLVRHHRLTKLSFFHTFQTWSITFLTLLIGFTITYDFDRWSKYYKTTFLYLACFGTLFGYHLYVNDYNFFADLYSFSIIWDYFWVHNATVAYSKKHALTRKKILPRPPKFYKASDKIMF